MSDERDEREKEIREAHADGFARGAWMAARLAEYDEREDAARFVTLEVIRIWAFAHLADIEVRLAAERERLAAKRARYEAAVLPPLEAPVSGAQVEALRDEAGVAGQQRDAREHALRVAERERDEARAQLAALRQAACDLSAYAEDDDPDPPLWAALDTALAYTAAAAEAHARRVRAEALREAADAGVATAREWGHGEDAAEWARWLRARADEIEWCPLRGERRRRDAR